MKLVCYNEGNFNSSKISTANVTINHLLLSFSHCLSPVAANRVL